MKTLPYIGLVCESWLKDFARTPEAQLLENGGVVLDEHFGNESHETRRPSLSEQNRRSGALWNSSLELQLKLLLDCLPEYAIVGTIT